MRRLLPILAAGLAALACAPADAGTVLVATSTVDAGDGYRPGYGNDSWQGFTAALDGSAATAQVAIQTTPNLNDAAAVDAAGAIWVDLRNNGETGVHQLAVAEKANLQAFIASGRRVVFIGENSSWASWSNSFLGLVGASHAGNSKAALAPAAAATHPLLDGVSSIQPTTAGLADLSVADNPVSLFDAPVATLFGDEQNVLAILDSELFADGASPSVDNDVFRQNTIDWLVSGAATPVPSPTAGCGGLVLIALVAMRRGR